APRWITGPTSSPRSSCSTTRTRRRPAAAANPYSSRPRAARPPARTDFCAVDHEAIRDLFSAFGSVSVRRMFGGAGLYAGATMFALVADGVIYLKAGPANTGDFEREGLEPFTYIAGNGKRAVMSYRRMPDRLYDDP